MGDVGLLAGSPGRLGRLVRVGADPDDVRDPVAEPLADVSLGRRAALVFDGVMEQGRDRLVLVSAVLKDDRCDRQQVLRPVDGVVASRVISVAAGGWLGVGWAVGDRQASDPLLCTPTMPTPGSRKAAPNAGLPYAPTVSSTLTSRTLAMSVNRSSVTP